MTRAQLVALTWETALVVAVMVPACAIVGVLAWFLERRGR